MQFDITVEFYREPCGVILNATLHLINSIKAYHRIRAKHKEHFLPSGAACLYSVQPVPENSGLVSWVFSQTLTHPETSSP